MFEEEITKIIINTLYNNYAVYYDYTFMNNSCINRKLYQYLITHMTLLVLLHVGLSIRKCMHIIIIGKAILMHLVACMSCLLQQIVIFIIFPGIHAGMSTYSCILYHHCDTILPQLH